jgi:hypothetical protein
MSADAERTLRAPAAEFGALTPNDRKFVRYSGAQRL